MKNRMFMGPLAGALLLFGVSSCGGDKAPVETTVEDSSASGDAAVVMTDGANGMASADPEAMYRMRGRRIADKVYTDLHMTDTTMRSRLATTYYSRARRYGEMRTKYQADTMGQYQAMRQAEMEYDKELQGTVLTDPKMYKEYETHRMDYSDDKYMDDASMNGGSMSGDQMTGNSADGSMPADKMPADKMSGDKMSGGADAEMAGDKMDGDKAKVKIKGEDGSKLKMKDGDIKVKDAYGNKTKMNGN